MDTRTCCFISREHAFLPGHMPRRMNLPSFSRWIVAHRGLFDGPTNFARREIVAGVLSGMRFIHDHGFIHCDLKVR